MRKIHIILLALVTMLVLIGVAMAKPVWLVNKAGVKAVPITVNGKQFVRFTFQHADLKDKWHDEYVAFCPDPLRGDCDDNIPFHYSHDKGDTTLWDIPLEVISGGQSAVNWANDDDWFDALWLGLPDCRNLTLEDNLIYYKSVKDKDIPRSGGMHLLYIGPGAPFVPAPDDPNIYHCGDERVVQVPITRVEDYPANTQTATAPKAIAKAQKKTCDPCEVLKEVKADTTVIREDTTAIRQSVGDVDKTEAPENQTLQQKVRKVQKSMGVPGKSEKSLHEKIGEPVGNETVLSNQAEIKKSLGVTNEKETLIGNQRDIKSGIHWLSWALIAMGVILAIVIVLGVRRNNNAPPQNNQGGGGNTAP